MSQEYDIIIIGSGPAGYTAAIYAARAYLSVLVLQGYEAGGQLMLTSDVENYPGFVEGILGPFLMEAFERQARRFGTTMVAEDVTEIDFSQRPFVVKTYGEVYCGRTLIICTGASAKWLGLANEERLRGRGVTACATCDGRFFQGKDVVVIGGGDTAMEEALYLTRYVNHVTVVHRRSTLRASKIMQERAIKHPKISFLLNREVVDVLGDESVIGVHLLNTETGLNEKISTQGVFLAIGHKPNTELCAGYITLNESGYIVPVNYTMTNIPGVFAAGDVTDPHYRQAITAAADGCRAAIDAQRWLEHQREHTLQEEMTQSVEN